MPAPERNSNNLKHGRHLKLAALPKGLRHVTRQVNAMRRQIEGILIERDGEVGLYAAATIQTACRHESRAQTISKWLRDHEGELELLERVSLLKEIGAASDARDKALQKLDLDKRTTADLWATYDAEAAAPAIESPKPADDATEAQTPDSGHEGAA